MDLQIKEGWIEVICGSMFAGKTEELIRRIKRIEFAKKEVIVFKPKIDNRYSDDEVVSHNDKRAKSVNVQNSREIDEYLNGSHPYAIAIDEVQFFDRGIIDVCEKYANNGVRVIVAGLDKDFRGEPFGVMPDFLARGEYVTKLTAICQKCGEPATRTQRLIDGRPASFFDPIVLVGAKESYEPRCRHCHEVLDAPRK